MGAPINEWLALTYGRDQIENDSTTLAARVGIEDYIISRGALYNNVVQWCLGIIIIIILNNHGVLETSRSNQSEASILASVIFCRRIQAGFYMHEYAHFEAYEGPGRQGIRAVERAF